MGRWTLVVVFAIGCGDNITQTIDGTPLLELDGSACTFDGQCDNGHCIAGVCCHTACESQDTCSTASCVTGTCAQVNTAACSVPICQLQPNTCATWVDSDGDGFSDLWETNGYIDVNCNGVQDDGDVVLVGADPHVPDIYVQYDWLDYGPIETPCTAASDCTTEAGLAGFTCTGPPIAGSPHSCQHACTTDAQCTGLGATHVADRCDTASNTCFHSHDPALQTPPASTGALPSSLQRVVAAFAARGYALHIIRGHGHAHSHVVSFHGMGEANQISATCEGASTGEIGVGKYAVSLFDLKAEPGNAFDPKLAPYVHYMVFAHYNSCDSVAHCNACPVAYNPDGTPKTTSLPVYRSSGVAEVGGNDFIVSLANFSNEVGNPFDDFDVGGTFMHELGHNLGLRHGGGDDTNFKPNYLSVMNYSYQFVGIPTTQGPRVDYSTAVLPTGTATPGVLNENGGLDEAAGLGGVATDRFFFTDAACNFQIASTAGPVDWDGDMTAGDAANATADLSPQAHPNNPCGSDTTEMFTGKRDWLSSGGGAPFTYAFQCTSFYSDGAGPPDAYATHELTAAEAAAAHVARAPLTTTVVRTGCKSPRRIALAVLGSATLDVTLVDRASLRVGRARPVASSERDVDGDGRLDLVIEVVSHAGSLRVTGVLVGGRAFSGATSTP